MAYSGILDIPALIRIRKTVLRILLACQIRAGSGSLSTIVISNLLSVPDLSQIGLPNQYRITEIIIWPDPEFIR